MRRIDPASSSMPEDLVNKVIVELTSRFASMIEIEYGSGALVTVSEIISDRIRAAIEASFSEGWDG